MANLKTGVSRKQSTPKFPKNRNFLPPDKKCLFFGNFGVLCFLETPVLRFAFLPYYRQNKSVWQRLRSSIIYKIIKF